MANTDIQETHLMLGTTAHLLHSGDPACTRPDLVGGKAAHLKELVDRGFNVPPWMVLTTATYDTAVDESACDGTKWSQSEVAERLCHWSFPTALSERILRSSAGLVRGEGSERVAVRSSSTAEDLAGASFAGQYDTFLNVRVGDDVLDAVRNCWASMWSDHAISYHSHVQSADRPQMAVIVQQMVDVATAGVMHTANPVTGSRRETVIEAVRGLGEAVVSGTVIPDHYLLSAGEDLPTYGCLTPPQLQQLHDLAGALTRSFGGPQDVEWAFDKSGTLWLTQTRPITTLFPSPINVSDTDRAYWSVNVYQGLTRPFTPLGSDFIRQRQRGMQTYMTAIGFDPELIDVNGWMYWDITEGVVDPRKRSGMVAFTNRIAAPSGDLIQALADSRRFSATKHADRDTPPAPRPRRWRTLLPILLLPAVAHAWSRRSSENHVARLKSVPGPSTAERFAYVRDRFENVCGIEANIPRTANTAGHTALELTTTWLQGYASEAEISAAFKGVPRNPTTEMDLALWRAAVSIAGHPPAREMVLTQTAEELADRYHTDRLDGRIHSSLVPFLAEYGCRATAEIDLGVTRWSENPAPVFTSIINYVRAIDAGVDAEADFAIARRQAHRAVMDLAARIPWRQHPLRRIGVLWMLTASRSLKGLRELPKLCLMRGFADLRCQLLSVGADLESAGLLDSAEDIVFLHLEEIEMAIDGSDLRTIVSERRDRYKEECTRTRIPAVTLSDGTTAQLPATGGQGDTLQGIGAAAGTVTGRARIVTDPHVATIEEGEILVCPSTDPGWTPLFFTAAALVTETGGMISHGTTVAREYGIPAVVGVPNATARIHPGQLITVNGDTGSITISSAA